LNNHIFEINGKDTSHSECFCCGLVSLTKSSNSPCPAGIYKHTVSKNNKICIKCGRYCHFNNHSKGYYLLPWSETEDFYVSKDDSTTQFVMIEGCIYSDDDLNVKDILE